MKKKKKKKKNKRKINIKKARNRESIKKRRINKKRRKPNLKKNKLKKRKGFTLKLGVEYLIKSIRPRYNFNLQGFLNSLTSPLVNIIRDYKRKKEKLKIMERKKEEKQRKLQSSLRTTLLKKEIREEQTLAKTRAIELKNFLREEQKAIREKEREKQRKFLEEVKLEKTLERFRARELDEIKAIEKYTLNLEKEEYKDFQKRIDQVREKYKDLRNERLRKRVEELGVTLSDQASAEEIRQKEKEYLERRELIETSLESFTRSATSLVYQINKRYLPKNSDLIRVINLVYEQSEIIIREDQEQNENFLILIYVNEKKKDLIVVEDKIKQETREYNSNAIFKFGDDMTDSLILYLQRMRERMKKAS